MEQFSDEANAAAPRQVEHVADRVGNLVSYCVIRQVDAALKHARREARQRLHAGVRVNCRQRAGMTCVQRLQQVERLGTTHFANHNAIRSMP